MQLPEDTSWSVAAATRTKSGIHNVESTFSLMAKKGILEACQGFDTRFSSFSTSPRTPRKAKMELVHNQKGQSLVYRYAGTIHI